MHDLITMGADLARVLHGQATAQAAQPTAPQPAPATQQFTDAQQPTNAHPTTASETLITLTLTLAFDRIARAVRRSILLARTLTNPVQPAQDPAQHRAATRRRIIREVEDAIHRTASIANDGRDTPETLQVELRDRLDAPDLDDDIATRPTPDIISEICRDLGLATPPGGAHPWKRRTPQDIAQLHAAASAARPQPGAGPQTPRRDAAQPTPGPQPDPAARPRAQPAPIHARSSQPEDPAATLATILRHPTRVHGRWRPPLQP